MLERANPNRRHFVVNAGLTLAATQLAILGTTSARAADRVVAEVPAVKPRTHTQAIADVDGFAS